MQFQVLEPGIEHTGAGISAVLDGFKQYPTVAAKYLAKFGMIKDARRGIADLDLEAWYPLDNWMNVFKGIAEEVGFNSLYGVGKSMLSNVPLPPQIDGIKSAMRAIDVAYHMSHRRNGVVMFDAATGMMLEGIGHYVIKDVEGERKMICVCENPYPCDFDRGLLASMATRFETYARVTHDASAPCRKKGGDSCTYVVTW